MNKNSVLLFDKRHQVILDNLDYIKLDLRLVILFLTFFSAKEEK